MKVYKTRNKINNKIYIGITNGKNPDYLGSGILLNVDIKRFGRDSFEVEILEDNLSLEDIEERERYWISFFQSTNREIGYNIATGGSYRKKVPKEKIGLILKKHYEKYPEKKLIMSKKRIGNKRKSGLSSESLKRYWSDKKKTVVRKKSENGSASKTGEKNPMYGKSGNSSPTSIKFSNEEKKFILENYSMYTLKQLLEEFKKKFNRTEIKSVKSIRRILKENGI